MSSTIRDDNLEFLARCELKRLQVHFPTDNQMSTMKAMLSDIGTLSTRLTLNPVLTQQEIACLVWIIRGKSSTEIAKILRLQHATVRSYLVRIKRKLNAETMPQAVYEAIRYNYIRPKFLQK